MRSLNPEMHYNYHGSMMIPSILCTIFFTMLIIFLIVRIVKPGKSHWNYFHGKSFGENEGTTKAIEILNIRYANSEITDEEYIIKKEHLLKK
ncbi:MAG: SHOCT domain-containing protein [Clostridiaceae bacterium]|nr:SHOCT domain-containing protein [Clostridiaceae bacterium]